MSSFERVSKWSRVVAMTSLVACGSADVLPVMEPDTAVSDTAEPDTGTPPAGEDEPLDAETASLLGSPDAPGAIEGSVESCLVRKLASTANVTTLDGAAGLNRTAAEAIAAATKGPDGEAATADDVYFFTLADLDAVPYVGPKAYSQLLAHATATGLTCGETSLQVLAINDFHGNLEPPLGGAGQIQTMEDGEPTLVDAGGAEFLATHVAALRAQNPNSILVAAGDMVGGTPLLSAAFHDEPTIESLDLLGLEVAGVGNHEFDEGPAELMRLQEGGCHPVDGCQDGDGFDGARFQFLAANVFDEATDATFFPPYTIRRFGNNLVAFIGMTLEGTPFVTTDAGVVGLRFADEADTANALVKGLQEQGVETIVVLLHEGGFISGLYDECDGISGPVVDIVKRLDPAIDVVVTGHTHQAYNCVIENRIVTSAAHAGRIVSDIDLVIDEATGDVKTMTAANIIVTRTVDKDAAQSALIAKYDALIAPIANRVVGSVTEDLTREAVASGETALGNLIADAHLEATKGQGAVAAFMHPGGIRANIIASQTPAGEQPGEVTFAELFAVQPFSNNLVVMTLTGAQIEQLLELQWGENGVRLLSVSNGLKYVWDAPNPPGDRIDPSLITLNGEVIAPDQKVRIAVNGFLADGSGGFSVLADGTEREPGPGDLDALVAYFEKNSPVSPPALDRVSYRIP